MAYNFVDKLEEGEHWENVLDDYFRRWYTIKHVNMELQRKGIDRIFEREGSKTQVEYKADNRTRDTGNLFIETMSIIHMGRYGWAWTSQADMLVYLAIPSTLYMFNPRQLRDHIPEWEKKYGTKKIPNHGWQTLGIPVPERVFINAEWCKTRRLK